jgi:type IV secretion system protein TrbL
VFLILVHRGDEMSQNINVLDTIDYQFLQGFQHSMHAITAGATNLAYWLAYIGITFTVCLMLAQGEAINKVIPTLLRMCFVISIFFGLITLCDHWVPEWLSSFMKIGGQAGNLQGLDPSSIFSQGYYIATSILKTIHGIGITHLPTALAGYIAALFIVIIYAFIASSLAVVLIKAYALVAVGPMIFAFGTNEVTRPTVNNYINKLVGMGLNILMMYIIIGIGVQVGQGFVLTIRESAASGAFNFGDILIIIGGLVIFYLVVQNVPAFIAEIGGAGGFRDYGQAALAASMGAAAMITNTIRQSAMAPANATAAAVSTVGGSIRGAKTAIGTGMGATQGVKGSIESFQKSAAAFSNPGVMNKAKGMGHAAAGVAQPIFHTVRGGVGAWNSSKKKK